MEIILKEDIIGLGYKNDIVNVKSGYGRNYLIPQGKGVIASPSAKKILAENLKQQAHKLAAIKAEAEKKAEALNGVELTITAKMVGDYVATIHFHKEVEVVIPVKVVSEAAPVEEVKAEEATPAVEEAPAVEETSAATEE